MAQHLKTKFADKLTQEARVASVVANRFTDEFNFVGAKTVQVSTIVTQPLNDYQRSGDNRYGTPKELEDTMQEMTVTQDKSFAITVDKGNNEDQGNIKKTKTVLRAQMREQVVPTQDKYVLGVLASKAGTIVKGAALTKANIIERIADATAALDDAEIPESGRTLWVTAEAYKYIKLSPEFEKVDKIKEKALTEGVVGKLDNMDVIKVPKSRMPANVNFIVGHRNSATNPIKISDTKIHKDPPGLSGDLIEGRVYYDAFVVAPRAKGIYADVSGDVLAAPTVNATSGAISGASGATFIHTTAGSDPRYSKTAVQGNPSGVTAGMVVKAYATKAGSFDSPVTEVTITA